MPQGRSIAIALLLEVNNFVEEAHQSLALLTPDVEVQQIKLGATPEEMWEKFIARLNEVQPLGKLGTHQAFLGSIEKYKRIYLEANK